jgi:hypothetical protein
MDSLDYLHVHQLPFFSGDASTGVYIVSFPTTDSRLYYVSGKNALPDVKNDLNYFIKNGKGKKMVFDEVRGELTLVLIGGSHPPLQNGWPSVSYQGVEPNSQKAVANVASEKVSIH